MRYYPFAILLFAISSFLDSTLLANDEPSVEIPRRFFHTYCLACHTGSDAANGLAFDDIDQLALEDELGLADSKRLQRALKADDFQRSL